MWKPLLLAVLAIVPATAKARPHTNGKPNETTTIVVTAPPLIPMHVGGRVRKDATGYAYQWPGAYFETAFQGPEVGLDFDDNANNFNVIIDGKLLMVLHKPGHRSLYVTAEGAGPHTVRLEKRSETQYAVGRFIGFRGQPAKPVPARSRQIEFIGDSLTVGYGNTSAFTQCTPDEIFETTDSQEGFGALTARHFDADYQINAFSGLGMVRNYDGREHPKYHMPMLYPRAIFDDATPAVEPDWHPQVIVIGIGGNDFSTPVRADEPWHTDEAMAADYRKTYIDFVQHLRAANPKAQIVMFWNTDDNNGYAANAQKVFEALKASGVPHIDSLVLPKLAFTGCNGHPNIHDDAKVADQLIAWFDAHPDVWQGK